MPVKRKRTSIQLLQPSHRHKITVDVATEEFHLSDAKVQVAVINPSSNNQQINKLILDAYININNKTNMQRLFLPGCRQLHVLIYFNKITEPIPPYVPH